jgi:hypothetical protein
MRGRYFTEPMEDEGQVFYGTYRGRGAGTLRNLPRTRGRYSTEPTEDEGQVLCVDDVLELGDEDLPGQLEHGLVLQVRHPAADALRQTIVLSVRRK